MQKRILIVEDEPAIRDMVSFALRKGDYDPVHAGDAREAQAAIADRVPDLILLDWMLPGTSGLELARRWRKESLTREVPIIMLTARGEENDRVSGLESGVYRYLPMSHQLLHEFSEERLADKLVEASLGQSFAGRAAVTFLWAAVPYRMEWRYGAAAHKVIALDAGHVCQNLYLACEAIHAGTCAIAAYDQKKVDALLRLDGEEEFVIYLAPVGKVSAG